MSGVDWGNYEATPPYVDRPLDQVSRREAERAFEQLMGIKSARKAQLVALLQRNGVEIDESDGGARRLGGWIARHAEPDRSEAEQYGMRDIWYVVAQDAGLLLGDSLIKACNGLDWQLFTGPRSDMSYQRPVVMGFKNVKDSLYNYDPILVAANFAMAAASDSVDESELASGLQSMRKLA